MFTKNKRIGILGGGQLGRMLCQAASPLDLEVLVMDAARDFPAGTLAHHFEVGDFADYADVLRFGRQVDVLTIEIEHVNTEALAQLEAEGIAVHPSASALSTIKDKGMQKQFFQKNGIPTAEFRLFDSKNVLLDAIESGEVHFPFVQKTRKAGYDGRGVAVINRASDVDSKLLDGACLIEEKIEFAKELAVVAAKSPSGEVAFFTPVEMDFHPEANLVETLICPANIPPLVAAEAEALAERVIRAFDVCGLLAVEMFLTHSGKLLVNEVAPRPHNSGHHTIHACRTSQFEQHLRAILDLPLGDTQQHSPQAVMLNLLGEIGHQGTPFYAGLEECLAVSGVFVVLYGKKQTKPNRKMGHVTILADTREEAMKKADFVKATLKVFSSFDK